MVPPGIVQCGSPDSQTPSWHVRDVCMTLCFWVSSVCFEVYLKVGASECVPMCVYM